MLKKIALIFIALILIHPCLAVELSGDLDGNGTITLEDIAYFMGWFMKGRPSDPTVIVEAAEGLYPSATGPITRIPDPEKEDFFGKSSLSLNDIAIAMAYFMKGRTTDFSAVETQANNLYPGTDFVSKLPGTPIGTASFTTTITGITTDP
jgi:hypothetical protein